MVDADDPLSGEAQQYTLKYHSRKASVNDTHVSDQDFPSLAGGAGGSYYSLCHYSICIAS